MAVVATEDAIEMLYQYGERLNESKDKSKVLLNSPSSACVEVFINSWKLAFPLAGASSLVCRPPGYLFRESGSNLDPLW